MERSIFSLPRFSKEYFNFVVENKHDLDLAYLVLGLETSSEETYITCQSNNHSFKANELCQEVSRIFKIPVLACSKNLVDSTARRYFTLNSIVACLKHITENIKETEKNLYCLEGYRGFNPTERLEMLSKLNFVFNVEFKLNELIQTNTPKHIIQEYLVSHVESALMIWFCGYRGKDLIKICSLTHLPHSICSDIVHSPTLIVELTERVPRWSLYPPFIEPTEAEQEGKLKYGKYGGYLFFAEINTGFQGLDQNPAPSKTEVPPEYYHLNYAFSDTYFFGRCFNGQGPDEHNFVESNAIIKECSHGII